MTRTTSYVAVAVLTMMGSAFTPACSSAQAGKEKTESSESALAGVRTADDLAIVGSLDAPSATATIAYENPPRYRSYKFGGAEGDKIDIWVRSKTGDAIAWVLDDNFRQVAKNDDASASTLDSHIAFTVKAKETFTHYLVLRDYDHARAKFDITFTNTQATPDYYSCKADADCVTVPSQCCSNLGIPISVRKGQEEAYHTALGCAENPICPRIMTRDYHGMPECNTQSHKCDYVLPADIKCQGFTTNPHKCPQGYDCLLNHIPDVPGSCAQTCAASSDCYQFGQVCTGGHCASPTCAVYEHIDPATGACVKNAFCGGIAAFTCPDGQSCMDDPTDSCDPNKGGADCGGVCVP